MKMNYLFYGLSTLEKIIHVTDYLYFHLHLRSVNSNTKTPRQKLTMDMYCHEVEPWTHCYPAKKLRLGKKLRLVLKGGN